MIMNADYFGSDFMSYMLPRVSPESVGISSQSVIDFLYTAKENRIAMHSLMILRHGKTAVELYWDPYTADSKNHVYSFSKTFVSAAIGFAAEEGLIDYNDRLCSFFPRYMESGSDERMHSITVENLLTMTSGMVNVNEITVVPKSDWVRFFLNSHLSSFPGEKFNYNSLNTYMLAAILRKVSGMGLIEYLTPRLFEPLGITDIYSDKCPMGRDIGGWGIHIRTEDMAKFGQLLLDNGKIGDRQILPMQWLEKAACAHADTTSDTKFPIIDDVKNGYGYQVWINRDGESYRADGMLGQFALILPKLDTVIVSTAGNMDEYAVLDLIWDKLISSIDSNTEYSVTAADKLSDISEDLSIIDTEISIMPLLMSKYNETVYNLPPNRQSIFPMLFRYSKRKVMSGIESFSFHFGNQCSLSWVECESQNTVPLIFDGKFHKTTIPFFGIDANCYVYSHIKEISIEQYLLEVILTFTDTPHSRHLSFIFNEDTLTVKFNELPSYTDIAKFVGDMVSSIRSISPHISKMIGKIAEVTITAKAEKE